MMHATNPPSDAKRSQQNPLFPALPPVDPALPAAPRAPQQSEDESRLSRRCTRADPPTHILTANASIPRSSTLFIGKVNAEPDMQADPSAGGTPRHHADVMITASSDAKYPDLIFKCVAADKAHDPDELDTPVSEDIQERPGRVRFRSRVRITSGLNRHRHKSSYFEQQESPHASFSRSSSLSGSPSSSISAPLRSQTEDEVGKPGWGTLGQRVSILAQGNMQRRRQREQREAQTQALLAKSVQLGIDLPSAMPQYGADERTPLITPSSPYLYLRRNGQVDNASNEDVDEEEERLARDVDLVFGPWPTRFWNHHWWWWKMEPIICCRCLTELDDEG